MVEFNGGFNADEHESVDFETIPEGHYNVTPVESERKEMGSGNGHMLTVKFQILDGEQEGRFLWSNFSMWHKSEQARKFAKAEFANLLKAVETPRISDSREIHNKPLTVKVGHRKHEGKVYAEIKGYYLFGNMEKLSARKGGTTEKAPWE